MVVSLDVGFLDSSVPLPLLCNLLASSSRSVKRVVGSDDMKGLLNSKVLGLVMSNIFFFLDCLPKTVMDIFTKEIENQFSICISRKILMKRIGE